MRLSGGGTKGHRAVGDAFGIRANAALCLVGFGFFLLIGRLFQLQVLEGKSYSVLASDQHDTQTTLIPKRGTIYFRDFNLVPADQSAPQVAPLPLPPQPAKANPSAGTKKPS